MMGGEEYTNYPDWKDWHGVEFASYDRATAVYFAKEMRLCGIRNLAGLEVLEVGFGNGSFAGWARKQGARYRGTEAIPELLALARSNGLTVQGAAKPLDCFVESASLDAVFAFDVFEHMALDRLREFLESVQVFMKSGALLVGRVPSGDSPFARATQHGDLTHRIVLGSSAVEQLAHEAGFEVVQLREPAFPVLGLGTKRLVRRVSVASLRRLMSPIIGWVFMANPRAVLTPNLLFVLRKP